MKRINSAALVVLVAGSAVAIATQVVASPKTTTDTKVTVTGCVTKADRAGEFVLTSDAPVPTPEPVATGTTGAPTLDRPAAMEHQPSYALKGEHLKGHLGHKVEITGTTPAIAAASTKAPETSPATPTTAVTAAPAPLAILDVTTIKMIAATCS